MYDTPRSPAPAYFSTFTRVWELALGAALAIGAAQFTHLPGWARAALGWVGIAAIALAAVAFSDATPMPGYAALLPTLGAAAGIAAGIGDDRSRGAPTLQPLQMLAYPAPGQSGFLGSLSAWKSCRIGQSTTRPS